MAHITFIHGIANKPKPDVLLRLWRQALAVGEGLDLGTEGVTSSMVYWADVMYEAPKPEMAEHESNDSIIERDDEEIDMSWFADLKESEQHWSYQLKAKLGYDTEPPDGDENHTPPETGLESSNFERIPLPWWLKRRLMKILLRDVHHYLFNAVHSPRPGITYHVQDEIRDRFVRAVKQNSEKEGPHIVVSHSMGTVIAYDCLNRVADCPRVDGLMTIGSPLGLDEIQDKLKPEWSRENGFPVKVGKEWINIYDSFDPVVGFDPKFANDYKKNGQEFVEDINEQNSGTWRHNISKYLGGEKLRNALTKQLGF